MYSMTVFFFNDTATTEIYTLSLHDALPICISRIPNDSIFVKRLVGLPGERIAVRDGHVLADGRQLSEARSEEHTSELQSRQYLVCRLLLEKKTNVIIPPVQLSTYYKT